MNQRTLVLLKPDALQRGIVGEILSRFERMGLKIVGMKMVTTTRDHSKKHYSAHVDKAFYANLENYIVSGPLIALVLEGVEAVANVRKVVGATEPFKAPPGTIRGDYAHHTMASADAKKRSVFNLIHASGTPEEAVEEVKLWFTDAELFDYKTVHEEHVF